MIKQTTLAVLALLSSATAGAQTANDSIDVCSMDTLREIVIKGNLPNTRLKGNAMITRIEGTALAETGLANEMLVKIPGMTGSEDSPEVLGKGTPIIYINGRLLRDMDELKRLNSRDIRDVEVINNPGSQYDATVRAVVRIRTKKLTGEGFGLNLSGQNSQDLRYGFALPQGKLDMNYRTGGVDVFAGAWYVKQDYRQYSTLEETTLLPGRTFTQSGPYTMTWNYHQIVYNAGANWQINDNHSVGCRVDLTHHWDGVNKVIYDEEVTEMTDVNGNHDFQKTFSDHLYSDQTSKETRPLGVLTNTYYNGTVGKLGIDFNFDYMKNGSDTDRENVETSQVKSDIVHSASSARSHLTATKLVLSYPIWRGSLDFGTEMTFAKRHSTYSIDKAGYTPTDADITEKNIAGFVEYNLPQPFLHRGDLTVGLRYEHIDYDYKDHLGADNLHRPSNEWFPSAAYSVMLGPVQTALSYSIKTQRPDYFALNDAITYISRYSLQAGNSQLKNERKHDVTLNVAWKWLMLTASYERELNTISQWTYLLPSDVALIKHMNIDKPINNFSAAISATPRVGIWSLNVTLGVDKQDLFLDVTDERVEGGTRRVHFDKPVWTANVFNTLSFKHDWKLDVNLMFRSKGHSQNFYNSYNNLRLGVVLQKSLLRDKALTLRLAVTDILQRNRMNEFGDMGYYTIQQNNRYSQHKLVATVFYNFNSARSKYKGTGAGKEAQQRMSK